MTISIATLRLRYAAFTAVADERIGYWINDAGRTVTVDWGVDQEPATLALAAHNLAQSGALIPGGGALPAGVTRFRSGSVDISLSEGTASQGGYEATSYGREFLGFLRKRNGSGPMLVGLIC